ncbi:MAG TPA: hypothetical protein VF401_00060 [Candidatus Saccharimonadales bacterium]
MAELADQIGPKTQKLLGDLFRGAVREEITGLKQEITGLSQRIDGLDQKVDSLTQRVGSLESESKLHRQILGNQSILLRTALTAINSLKSSYRKQAQEVTRLGVLFEDLQYRFEAGGELG